MENLYIRVGWPEYQEYQQYEDFNDHSFYDVENDQYFIERKWSHSCKFEKLITDGMSDFDAALVYIHKNKTWSDAEEEVALERIGEMRCSIDEASTKIYDSIYDLLEEYGADNDLPEGWWMEYGEIDDFFMKL